MRFTRLSAASAAALLTVSAGSLDTRAADVLTLANAKVTVEGTSNVHDWTASTTAVVLTAAQVAGANGDALKEALQPGALTAFEVRIPARGLTSPKEGIDKNMHKALKVEEHPHVTFRLSALEPVAGAYKATGMLTIAGVEKEVVLTVNVQPNGGALNVTGTTDLVMTDFGVKPPSAMLGMIKTNPKVTIRLELTLAAN